MSKKTIVLMNGATENPVTDAVWSRLREALIEQECEVWEAGTQAPEEILEAVASGAVPIVVKTAAVD